MPDEEGEKTFQVDVQHLYDTPLLSVKDQFLDTITDLGPIGDSTEENCLLEWATASERILLTDLESGKQMPRLSVITMWSVHMTRLKQNAID